MRAVHSHGCVGPEGLGAAAVKRLRTAPGVTPTPRTAPAAGQVTEPDETPLPPKSAPWRVLRREAQREEGQADQALVAPGPAPQSALAKALALPQDCAAVGRQRQPAQRAHWLERAAPRALKAFARFAAG